jgi:hypothetical protein
VAVLEVALEEGVITQPTVEQEQLIKAMMEGLQQQPMKVIRGQAEVVLEVTENVIAALMTQVKVEQD